MSRERPHLSFSLKLVSSEKTYDYPQQSWQFQSHYSLRDYTGVYFIKLIPCTADAVSFPNFYFETSVFLFPVYFWFTKFHETNSLVQHKLKQFVFVVGFCCICLERTMIHQRTLCNYSTAFCFSFLMVICHANLFFYVQFYF